MANEKDTGKQTYIPKGERTMQEKIDLVQSLAREKSKYMQRHSIISRFLHPEEFKEAKRKGIKALRAENTALNHLINAGIAELKEHLSEKAVANNDKFQDYVNKIKMKREKAIARDFVEFGKQIEKSRRKAGTLTDPHLKEKEFDRIKKSIDNFYELQEKLNKQFIDNVTFNVENEKTGSTRPDFDSQ